MNETHPRADPFLPSLAPVGLTWRSSGSLRQLPTGPAGAPTGFDSLATTPHCSLEVARTQTLIACGSYESSAIHPLGEDLRCEGPKGEIAIRGMTDAVQDAFGQGVNFSELGLPWATPGETISLEGYDYFPSYRTPG